MDGWMFWAYRSFETVLQPISGHLPERGRRKKVQSAQSLSSSNQPSVEGTQTTEPDYPVYMRTIYISHDKLPHCWKSHDAALICLKKSCSLCKP